MLFAAKYLSVSPLVHHRRRALFVFFPHVPGRNLCGLTAIGIRQADTTDGMRDTGPVRRMQAHVGSVPATKADGITTAIGKAIADDSNTGTTGITIVTAATVIAIATIMTSRNNFQTYLENGNIFRRKRLRGPQVLRRRSQENGSLAIRLLTT